MEPPLLRYLKVKGLALFNEQYTNVVLKSYVISTFCAVGRVDLVCSTCKADSLKASTREKRGYNITGGSVHQITAIPKNWQDFF